MGSTYGEGQRERERGGGRLHRGIDGCVCQCQQLVAGWLAGLSAVTYRRAGYIDTGDLYCVDSDSNFTY